MPIIDSRNDDLDTNKDVKRHHEKIKEAIKKRLPEIIAQEDIITNDTKGRKIRIPIRSMGIPDLRHGKRNQKDGQGETSGVGQGSGKKGDATTRNPNANDDPDSKEFSSGAGSHQGEEVFEGEFSLEEIVDMMFEDLGLPNVLKKDLATLEISLGYKLVGSEKVGPMVLLKKRPTAKNAMKTFWVLMTILQEKFKNRSEIDCFAALRLTGGTFHEAEVLLSNPAFTHRITKVDPFPIIGNNDLRFFSIEEQKTSETNAVVIAILDASGSMSTTKKYISRAIIFWMVQVLRKQYTKIEIRFIVHHTEARLVEEKDFFQIVESGGTYAYSAFDLTSDLIRDKYPTDLWNVYVFYFSDGDDQDKERSAKSMKKVIESGVNLVAYADINDSTEFVLKQTANNTDGIIAYIKSNWPVTTKNITIGDPYRKNIESIELISGDDNFPFLAVVIGDKKHVLTVLREFLKKDR